MFHIYMDDNSFHIVVESLSYDGAYNQWKRLNFTGHHMTMHTVNGDLFID